MKETVGTKREGINVKDFTAAQWRDYQREWRERHPEHKQQARDRRYAKLAAETPEETAARRAKEKAYQAANRERTNSAARLRRAKNVQKAREEDRLYRLRNLERERARDRKNAKKNYLKAKPRIKAHNKLRRARQKGATKTEVILHAIVADRDGWRCHICGKRVTRHTWSIDHLVPLSRGGDHTYTNVLLAHRLCNIRRGNRPLEPLFLIQPAEPRRRPITNGG